MKKTLDQQYMKKKEARTGTTPSNFRSLTSTLKKITETTKRMIRSRR